MNLLNDLIYKACPNGIPYFEMDSLGTFFGGITGKSKTDFIDGNAAFITYRNVYTNPSLDINPEDRVKIGKDEKQRSLEYGDVIFTGSSETPDECGISSVVTSVPDQKLYLNSFCFVFRFNDPSIMDPNFAKYLFRSSELRKQIGKTASGVTRYNVSKKLMGKVVIPVPPKDIQLEIVRILENFELLLVDLKEEHECRLKQIEWCKMELLNSIAGDSGVKLDDCCSLEKGKTPIQKAVPGEYPLVVTTSERKSANMFQFDAASVCIPLVSSRGHGVACLNQVYYQEGKFALGNILCAVTPQNGSGLDAKFLYYYLNHKKDTLIVPLMKGGANVSLTVDSLRKIRITIPTMEDQKKIVDVLDEMIEFCDCISEEIENRQIQYDYYRDLLLDFNRVYGEG